MKKKSKFKQLELDFTPIEEGKVTMDTNLNSIQCKQFLNGYCNLEDQLEDAKKRIRELEIKDSIDRQFKRGDKVKFTDDYFQQEDLGMSGIVIGPRKNIYPNDEFIFFGYIENDKSGRCAIANDRKDIITIEGFLKLIPC
jgi:hypothetical protein